MRGVSGGSRAREEFGCAAEPLVVVFFCAFRVVIRVGSGRELVWVVGGSGEGDCRGWLSSCALGDIDSV